MQTQCEMKEGISYAQALSEAREWVMGNITNPEVPYIGTFINWYGWNAAKYTVESAFEVYVGLADNAGLVLRPESGDVSSAGDGIQGLVRSSDGFGPAVDRSPVSRSIPQGVVLWA